MLKESHSLFADFSLTKLRQFLIALKCNPMNLKGTWHPLGFIIIKLFNSTDFDYRLHIWPKGLRRPKTPDWPIHNHVFDLESIVLSGAVGSEAYSISCDESPEGRYRAYMVKYTSEGSDLVPSSTLVNLRSDGVTWTNQGEKYQVPKGSFHRSIVNSDVFAATLVRTSSKSVLDMPIVLGIEDLPQRHACFSNSVDRTFLVSLIDKISTEDLHQTSINSRSTNDCMV